MKRILIAVFITAIGLVAVSVLANTDPVAVTNIGAAPSTATFLQFNDDFTGDWQQYGQLFTTWQAGIFSKIFLFILTLIPALFLVHYIIIGPKKFEHQGPQVYYFGVFIRVSHWSAALSFSLLVVTGLMVIFGKFIGGGTLVMTGRSVHILSAILFTVSAIPMFLIWLKDMLPTVYDIMWFMIMGGYLSKKKKPVPAGKFNAGQKIWFWLATVGGGVMAYSGWYLYTFQVTADQLRVMAIIHNFLGAALVTLFIVHLYMSLFAIKGAMRSMLTGYKSREEVEILHSRYKIN